MSGGDLDRRDSSKLSTAASAVGFFSSVHRLLSLSDLDKAFGEFLHPYGIEYWTFSRASTQPHIRVDTQPLLFGRSPTHWHSLYRRRGYLEIDPVVRFLLRTDEAYRWDQVRREFLLDARQERIFEEACDYGIANGIAVPFRSWDGSAYAVSMGGEKVDPSPQALTAISIATHAYAGRGIFLFARRASAKFSGRRRALTTRQRDVLELARRGLTTRQIANELNIAVKTVEFISSEARSRLSARSMTQAVAKAIVIGELPIVAAAGLED